MHACPVPAAGLLLCPAMLLLALLASPTTAVAVNTLRRPAWRRCAGTSPSPTRSGSPARIGRSAATGPSRSPATRARYPSYWKYQVMDIFYEDRSFIVTKVNLQEDGSYCDHMLIGNTASDLGVGPFKINNKNEELFFLRDCQGQARQLPRPCARVSCANHTNSFAWLAGKYSPDDIQKPLPGNCTVALMPVLGYQGAVAADYNRLIKGGFLLEHSFTAEDCTPCTQAGSKCSVDTGEDLLVCQCSDGEDSFICGEYNLNIYAYA
ncbi:unnamed protein product [Miscanthus lutarioriparius]|uniref:Wall-associated receptor kinase C-terminal domain-containing protein n=1 Tax=Miscanthus lutarioriparius TaxID=422564 RepID=A0A811NX73_9POAL|nr:unnamed protein product [Miscanthus lutarioriparius]